MVDFNFSEEAYDANFATNQNNRKEYEASEEYLKDQQTDVFRERMAPVADKETAKVANDDDSGIVGNTLNFAKHAAIGAAKGVEEIGQTFRLLEDDAFHLPKPQTTAEGLAQGFGQFLPAFIPAVGAVGWGVRAAGLVGKTKKAKMAVDFLIGTAAGAVADVTAFDPKDPNAANFLLVSGAIAQDSSAGAAVKALLAQDDSDTEGVARLKSAATGMIAGAIVTGLFKGAGYAVTRVRGSETPLPVSGTKDITSSPEFKAWFKDSKVVDEQGNPLIVYHGTSEDFHTFDATKQSGGHLGDGFYFSPLPKTANRFARLKAGLYTGMEGANVRPVYLSLKNPKVFEDRGELLKHISYEQTRPTVLDTELLKSQGYDGVILKKNGSMLEGEISVFEPTQIKSQFNPRTGEVVELDGIPIKEVEDIAQKEAENYTDGILKSKGVDVGDGGPTYKISAEGFKKFGHDIPSIEGAAKDNYDKAQSDYVRPWEKLSPEKQTEAKGIIQRWAETGEVGKVDLKIIESMNFLKLKTREDIRHVMQFLSEKMDIKPLLKGRVLTESFDTEAGAAELLEIPQREMARIIEEQAGNVRGAIRFVGVARAMGAAAMKKAEDSFELFAMGGKDDLYKEGLEHTKLAYDMLASGGELSKASSDLLRSHQKLVGEVENLTNIKTALRHSVLYNDPELSIKQAGWFANSKRADEIKITAQFPGGTKQTRKIPKIEGETPAQFKARAVKEARRGELADQARATRRQLISRAKAANKSTMARGRDAMLEIYINGLLSSVKTFEVNLLGNSTAIITSVIERAYAGFLRKGGTVTGQEAAELAKSYWNSITSLSDLWSLMGQAWKMEPTGAIKQDFIRPHDRTLSAEGLKIGGNLGHMINMFGSVVNFPGRTLLAADEVFKTINYRAETRALAYRKAVNEVAVDGARVGDKVQIKNRFNEIMKDVSAHDDIVEGAKGFSAKNTFTNPLASHVIKGVNGAPDKVVKGMGLRLKGILDADPTGIMRVFLPFFQTPANLLNFAWERTPLLRKLNRGLQAELKGDMGQAAKELAEAKVGTSRMMWVSTMSLAMSGNFTGAPPVDPNLRKTLEADMGGAHWYSFQLNGKWHKYDRFDPIGVIMGASANLAVMGKAAMNLAGQAEEGDESGAIHEKYLEVLEAGTVGMVRLMTDRHYLQSFSEMLSLFSGEGSVLGKFQRAGEKVGTVFNPVTAMTTGFYSSIRRNITQGLEPEKLDKMQRTELKTLEDVVKEIGIVFEEGVRRVTPGYGEKRAVKNLAGEVTLYPGTNYEIDRQPVQVLMNLAQSVFNPSAPLTPSKSPLINALARLESTARQPSSINRINGVLLTDEEKGYFIDTWTDMNKALNKFVTTKSFLKLPEGMQRDVLENMISSNKRKASKLTMVKHRRVLQGAFDIKRNDLRRKTEDVPTGFNFANIREQGQQ